MQDMDSTIIQTQKKGLTDTQEKFLDALFGEAKGNPKKAGELAGYSDHSYPKVVRSLKSEIVSRAEGYLATHAAIRLEAAKQILDRIGIAKKEKIDISMKAVHGLFILPAKEEIKITEVLDENEKTI